MLRKTLITAAALAATLATPLAPADETRELTFGIISTESTQNLRTVWEPFLADMEKHTGFEVKPFFAPDYAGVIEAMRFDKVDLAWYGNKSAMVAVDRAGAEIFAQTVDVNGNPGYWSLLLTHKDSKLESLDDVWEHAGELSFGNGDPNSTSGFLVPGYYVFAQNGKDPNSIFKRVINANHETNALAVANKQVDLATNNTESLARIEANFPEKYEQIKVIWKSPLIPSDPIAWRSNLDPDTKAVVKEFFMSYGRDGADRERQLEVLAGLQWAPFRESDNNQLLPIRELELAKNRARIENDPNYSQEEKRAKLAEIDKQLAEISQKVAALEN